MTLLLLFVSDSSLISDGPRHIGSCEIERLPNRRRPDEPPPDTAQALVEKGRDILRQLKERTDLTANQQEWLDSIEADLRKVQEKK